MKPNPTVYDKLGLLRKNKSKVTVCDYQLPVDVEWESAAFLYPFHSHQAIPTPIPIILPWRFLFKWKSDSTYGTHGNSQHYRLISILTNK